MTCLKTYALPALVTITGLLLSEENPTFSTVVASSPSESDQRREATHSFLIMALSPVSRISQRKNLENNKNCYKNINIYVNEIILSIK